LDIKTVACTDNLMGLFLTVIPDKTALTW